MGLTLRHRTLQLPLRDPFRIARAVERRSALTIIVELLAEAGHEPGPELGHEPGHEPRHEPRHQPGPGQKRVREPWPGRVTAKPGRGQGPGGQWLAGGRAGVGECVPVPYYGESEETVLAALPRLLEAVSSLDDWLGYELAATREALEEASRQMDLALAGNRAAKAGLDTALHDLAARRLGLPLFELLEAAPLGPPTDLTLGIDEPALVARRAERARQFPALKIKVGGPSDLATLSAVRAVYAGPLRVDANTGWNPDEGARLLPELERLGVELIEQPFPAERLDQLRWLQERSPLPIVADESALGAADLDRLQGVVAGVNVKLAKCGGVGPALRMLRRARELGLRCMLGCMVETSVGIAASAALASLAEWVDLDGNLLLADDPFAGLELGPDCRWLLPATPGLGVFPRAGPAESPVRVSSNSSTLRDDDASGGGTSSE